MRYLRRFLVLAVLFVFAGASLAQPTKIDPKDLRDGPKIKQLFRPVIAESIEEGAKLLRERQIRLIVVLVPMKIRVMLESIAMSEPMRQAIYPEWDIPQPWTMAAPSWRASGVLKF